MIEPGKRCTAAEKAPLEKQGYEFEDATCLGDREPMFVVSRDPRPATSEYVTTRKDVL